MDVIGYEIQDSENSGKRVCLDHVVTKKYGWGPERMMLINGSCHGFWGPECDGMIVGWWK